MAESSSLEDLSLSNSQLRILIRFITSVISINSIEEVLWRLTKDIIGDLGFEDCVVYLVDQHTGRLKQVAAYGNKNPFDKEILNPITLGFDQGIVGRCARTQKPVLVNDTSESPDYVLDDLPRLSELAVPIICEGETIGVIDSEHSEKGFYTQQHLETLVAIASVISSKYYNAKTIQKLEHTISSMGQLKMLQQAIFEITELILSNRSFEEFLEELHSRVIDRVAESDLVFVFNYDSSNKRFFCPYQEGDERVGYVKSIDPKVATFKLLWDVLESGTSLKLDLPDLEAMQLDTFQLTDGQPGSLIIVPLKQSPQVNGVLVLARSKKRPGFKSVHEQLLMQLAPTVGNALWRKQEDERLQHLALHDGLTGLPNRVLFMDRLRHVLSKKSRDTKHSLSVMFIDLDGFKEVNDNYGHHIGDLLLIEVGQRILECLRTTDTLARLGGDEFAVLIDSLPSTEVATSMAQRIINAVAQPFYIEHRELSVSASIGLALCEQEHVSAEQLVKLADEAMYQSKESGKSKFTLAQESTSSACAKDNRNIVDRLQTAIEQQQFKLNAVPFLDMQKEKCAGLRAYHCFENDSLNAFWNEVNFHSIDKVYHKKLCMFTLARVAQHQGNRLAKGEPVVPVHFELTEDFLFDAELLDCFERLNNDYPLDNLDMVIEVSERMVVRHMDNSNEVLRALKSLGCKVALNNFGRGLSSLSYLYQLPIDLVHICRTFVKALDKDVSVEPTVKAIVSLANSLELDVIATGIDTPYQRETLLDMGVRYGTGRAFDVNSIEL